MKCVISKDFYEVAKWKFPLSLSLVLLRLRFVKLTKAFFKKTALKCYRVLLFVCLFFHFVCESIQFVYWDLYAKDKDATSNLQSSKTM